MRKAALTLAMVLCLSMLGGCKEDEMVSTPTINNATTEAASQEEMTTEPVTETAAEAPAEDLGEGMMRSHLTGEVVSAEVGSRRPISVMINNVTQALPQFGIGSADVMYECMVEGGLTRLMAVFQDIDGLEKIGPIRSARTYFVYLAGEWNSIYVHWGQCEYAKIYLEQPVTNNLNGTLMSEPYFFRDSSDGRKAPHNAFSDADGIYQGIEKKGYITDMDQWYDYLTGIYNDEIPETYQEHFKFAGDGETADMSAGQDATYIYTGFASNDSEFEYDATTGLYNRFQYGGKQIDKLTGEQLAYKNVFVIYSEKSDYYGTQYLQFDLWSDGDGYYFTDGKAIPIRWEKDTEWGPMRFVDAATGEEITVNQGKTWISIVPTVDMDKTKFE